jgi:hypothetical protein
MKRNQVLLLSLLALGVSGNALAEGVQASTFPADAEASYDLQAIETYAERHARMGEGSASWGVSKREVEPHNPFPFGGGLIDD